MIISLVVVVVASVYAVVGRGKTQIRSPLFCQVRDKQGMAVEE